MKCRICQNDVASFMTYGKMPVANGFLTADECESEYFFELKPVFCSNCLTFQIEEQPAPEMMFHDHYAFFSRTSKFMQTHFKEYQSISYTDDSSANRLKHYFNEWTPTWYNVTRTDVLKLGWEIVSTENIKNIFLQEHLLGGYLATQGKLHSGSYSYYYRQLDASAPSVTKTEVENNGDFFDRMLLETWSSDYEAFQRVLSQAIFDKDGVPYETARTIVQKAYRTFVAPVILDALTSELHRRKTLPMHVMFAFRKVKAVVSPATKLLKSFLSRENYRLDSNTMKVKSFLKASNHDLPL